MNLLLVDRIPESELLITNVLENTRVILIDSKIDSCNIILEKIKDLGENANYTNVGIVKLNDYTFFGYNINFLYYDPEDYFIKDINNFLEVLKNEYMMQNFDIISCNTYDDVWKTIIDKLSNDKDIVIRSSVDYTGGKNIGNWILESHNTNLIGLYFNEDIKTYPHILDFGPYSAFLDVCFNNAWAWGNNNWGNLQQTDLRLLPSFTRMIVPDGVIPYENKISLDSVGLSFVGLDLSGNNVIYVTRTGNPNATEDRGRYLLKRVRPFDPSINYIPDLVTGFSEGSYFASTTDGSLWHFGYYTKIGTGPLNATLYYGQMIPQKIIRTMVPSNLKAIKMITNGNGLVILFADASGNNRKIFTAGGIGVAENATNSTNGELGVGDFNPREYLTEMIMPTGKVPLDIFGGQLATWVLMTDNTLYACGYSQNGYLGVGPSVTANNTIWRIHTLTQVQFIDLSAGVHPVKVSNGGAHSVVLMNNGTVYATGTNYAIGSGNLHGYKQSYEKVVSLPNKIAVDIGTTRDLTQVLMNDGTLYVTGNGSALGLGYHPQTPLLTFEQPASLPQDIPIKKLYNAYWSWHTVIMFNTPFNNLYGAGYNEPNYSDSPLSIGRTFTYNPVPYKYNIPSTAIIKQISGGDDHFVVLMDDASGTIYSIGSNNIGQFGVGYYDNIRHEDFIAMNIPVGKKPIKITGSGSHTLVLMDDGSVYGCGYNPYGQLGLGYALNYTTSLLPMHLDSLPSGVKVKDIVTSSNHTAIVTDELEPSVWLCGNNGFGAFGAGYYSYSPNNNVPYLVKMTSIPSGKVVKQVSVGTTFTVVLMTDGTVYGCGMNNPYQGTFGGIAPQSLAGNWDFNVLIPVNTTNFPAGATVKKIACGDGHTVFLLDDASGTCYATGWNGNGECGLGTTTPLATGIPVRMVSLPTFKTPIDIQATVGRSMITMSDNTVFACGDNWYGQIGIGIRFTSTGFQKIYDIKKTVIKDSEYLRSIERAPPQELINSNDFSLENLLSGGYSLIEITNGQPLVQVVNSGIISLPDLINAGVTPQQLVDAGLGITSLLESGFTMAQLKEFLNYEAFSFEGYSYYYYYFNKDLPISPICFLSGTKIKTDQGIIKINNIDTTIHTISGKKIKAITETKTLEKNIIKISKNALGKNTPIEDTFISKNHKVLFNNKLIEAYKLIKLEGVDFFEYDNQILYNILMDNYQIVSVNNMHVETLDPNNIIAKIYSGKYSKEEQIEIIKSLNDSIKENDYNRYRSLHNY